MREHHQPSLSEDLLQLLLSPDLLALVHERHFSCAQHVVEQVNEGLWLRVPADAFVGLDELRLGSLEEAHQLRPNQVASAPHHEDAAVLEPPLEALHGGLADEAKRLVLLHGAPSSLDRLRTLVKEVNLDKGI